jgi:8-oxo-dGTP diphosphatase
MPHQECARAVVLRDDKLLVMKRTKFGDVFYALVGGGIEPGEDAETALRRELIEETGLEVGEVKLVFIETAHEQFGTQYVFLCEYIGGEPHLSADSPEALENVQGENTYEPLWLSLSEFRDVTFRSNALRQALLDALEHGFPAAPAELAWKG